MGKLECILDSGILSYVDKTCYIDAIERMSILARTYHEGGSVFYEGDLINRICIVQQGVVRAEKKYVNGDLHLLSIFEENSIFGLEVALSPKQNSPIDYIANEECTVIQISLASIERLPYEAAIKRKLTEMLADQNIRMANKIEILAERGLRDRIMIYFHILAQKAGSNVIDVRMSREQMSQFLRVNRSALSNEISKMCREGLIEFHRHQYILHNFNEDGTPVSQ